MLDKNKKIKIEHMGVVKFGIRRLRFWERYDHLIVVGYNKSAGKFFILKPDQIKKIVRNISSLLDRTSIEGMAKKLFRIYDQGNYLEAVFSVKGSIKVSSTAVSCRHFVFVSLAGMEEEMQTGLGYKVINLDDDLAEQVGVFHAEFVQRIIDEEKGKYKVECLM